MSESSVNISTHRFAVTGAQGTGKSTVAHDILDECCRQLKSDVRLLEGIGSEVGRMGLPLGQNANIDTLLAFVRLHFRREREAKASIILQDRCMLDLYSYARLLRLGGTYLRGMLEELTIVSLSKIDTIFYVPIAQVLRDRQSPNESSKFRDALATEIVTAAKELDIPLYYLDGDRNSRTALAIQEIRRHIQEP